MRITRLLKISDCKAELLFSRINCFCKSVLNHWSRVLNDTRELNKSHTCVNIFGKVHMWCMDTCKCNQSFVERRLHVDQWPFYVSLGIPVKNILTRNTQIKSIFVYLMEKSTTTVTDAKVVYRILLGGQCYSN